MSGDDTSKQIDRIVRHAFGPLAKWLRPITLKSVGPAFPEVFDHFEAGLATLRNDLHIMLTTRSRVEDLNSAFPASEAFNPLFDAHSRHGSLARRLARAKSDVPPDFVGGWSVKGKEIELGHWRGIPAFTIVEATLMSVGRDPRKTGFDALFRKYGHSTEADELLYFLEDREEQVARAFGLNPDDRVSVISAADFLRWVDESSLSIDDRFRRMLRERWADSPDDTIVRPVSVDTNDQAVHGTSRKAYARLVTSIAIQRYGLTQEREIGKVANRMRDDTDLAGLSLQAKPIRDLLRIGWSQLPPKDRP